MCLAIPGKIEKIEGKKATVDFQGIRRTVDLSFLEAPREGAWVLVHVGFAIQEIDEEAARETYHLLAKTRGAELEDELTQSKEV